MKEEMMYMKRNTSLLTICVFATLIQGCATLSVKQSGQFTSNPPGAHVYFYEPVTGWTKEIGVTPVEGYIQQGLWDVFLVAEKTGYEKEKVLLSKPGSISHHFILERSFIEQISEEAGSLTRDFKKGVVKILGTFDKALSSPRMLAASVVADARTQLQEMIIDYPQQKESATVRALRKLSSEAVFLTSLSSSDYNTSVERDSARAVMEWIVKIKTGLGLNM